jgi:hypothetical protein
MKRFLILLVVLAVIVAAVGLYRGWFTLSTEHGDGKGQVTGTVDEEKIDADKRRAEDEIRGLGHRKSSEQP